MSKFLSHSYTFKVRRCSDHVFQIYTPVDACLICCFYKKWTFSFQVLCCKSLQQLTTKFCPLPEADIESNTDFCCSRRRHSPQSLLCRQPTARQRPSSARCPAVANVACEPCTAPPSYFGKSSMTGGVQPEMEQAPVSPSLVCFKTPRGANNDATTGILKKSGIGSAPYMRPRSSGAVSTVMGRPSGIGSSRPAVVICSRPGSGDDSGVRVWVMGTSGLDFGSGKKGGAAPQIHFRNGEWLAIVYRLTLSLTVNEVAG